MTSFKSKLVRINAVNFIDQASCLFSQSTSSEASCLSDRDTNISRPSSRSSTEVDRSSLQEPQVEDIDEVHIHHDFPDHVVSIDSRLKTGRKTELIVFLSEHHDCFAWSHTDMTGIDPSIITHWLQVNPSRISVKQKLKKFAAKRNKIIDEEVRKLIDVGSVVEV